MENQFFPKKFCENYVKNPLSKKKKTAIILLTNPSPCGYFLWKREKYNEKL